MALYASASPRPVSPEGIALATPEAAQERVKRSKPNARPEGDATDKVLIYLKMRADIGGIVRFNSGTMYEQGRFIRMNTVHDYVWCEELQDKIYPRVADLQFVLWPGKIVAVEMKAPGWKFPVMNPGKKVTETIKREFQQRAYIEIVRNYGGIAGFATSVEEVKELIK